jgi:hypothetical protein
MCHEIVEQSIPRGDASLIVRPTSTPNIFAEVFCRQISGEKLAACCLRLPRLLSSSYHKLFTPQYHLFGPQYRAAANTKLPDSRIPPPELLEALKELT